MLSLALLPFSLFFFMPFGNGNVATVNLVPAGDSGVSGRLLLEEESDGTISIIGSINGLKAGKHGFHIHTNGELGNKCSDAGGHFNPLGVSKPVFWLNVYSNKAVILFY
jgi:Cu-Zn family superoxide dismutase